MQKYIDETTKLKNRNYFTDKLFNYLHKNSSSSFGVNILVALDDVKRANQEIGYLKVDDFFLKIAEIFKLHTHNIDDSIIARMNGSEFCLFLPKCSDKKALNIAKKIQNDVEILINETKLNQSIQFYLGLYGYNGDDVSKLLSCSDEVLKKAKLSKNKLYQKVLNTMDEVISIDKFKDIITKAIDTNNFYFLSFKAVDTKHKKVLHNRLSLSLKGDDNTVYRYNQFISIVEKTGLINKLYNNVLKSIFKTPDESLNSFICSLRLPYNYLLLDANYENLQEILNTYKNNLAFKLIIEIPNSFAYKYLEKTKLYKVLLKKYNISIGIYEFNIENDDYNYLQDLKPRYIKSEANYIISLDEEIFSNLRTIIDNTTIDLIATDVKNKYILDKLEEKEIHLIQGSIINLL